MLLIVLADLWLATPAAIPLDHFISHLRHHCNGRRRCDDSIDFSAIIAETPRCNSRWSISRDHGHLNWAGDHPIHVWPIIPHCPGRNGKRSGRF